MSASLSENAAKSVANQEGQVGSHIARDQPQTTHGHKPGVLTGNDAVPESHVQVLPAGTAPKESTFKPQNASEIPGQSGDNYAASQNEPGTTTSASDTVLGSTSADVHKGAGHPGQGMSSNEIRNDGGKQAGGGLQGVGASGAESHDQGRSKGIKADDVPTDQGQNLASKNNG